MAYAVTVHREVEVRRQRHATQDDTLVAIAKTLKTKAAFEIDLGRRVAEGWILELFKALVRPCVRGVDDGDSPHAGAGRLEPSHGSRREVR
jgi:hypothetical protein